MLKLMLLLHLLTAIFAIGPLVHGVTTASRGLRQGDAAAVESSARMAKIYSIASVLVVIFGFGLMSQKRRGKELGSFGDTWIWLSLVLWVIAIVVTFVVIVPSLDRAAETLRAPSGSTSDELRRSSSDELRRSSSDELRRSSSDEPNPRRSSSDEPLGEARIETTPSPSAVVSSYTARVAASGGVVGIIFAVIVVLMVYRPGS